jgi:hypothetical protein
MKLKPGQIYLHKTYEYSPLGILRRNRRVFGDRRKFNWELEFKVSIYPEELNSGFLKDIEKNYVYIGNL